MKGAGNSGEIDISIFHEGKEVFTLVMQTLLLMTPLHIQTTEA